MQNKLQELTDRLYQEGLSRGKEDGELFLANAKKQGEQIVADAKAEAEKIILQARQQAQDLKDKAKSDVKMASEQALQATKKDIENLLLSNIIDKAAKETLSKTDFLKEIILCVAKNFSAQESCDLALVLPENLKSELEGWVAGQLEKQLGKQVKAEFSNRISGGFNIGPANGSYYISLSDETFSALICEYLRPLTKKVLFGE